MTAVGISVVGIADIRKTAVRISAVGTMTYPTRQEEKEADEIKIHNEL